jgi:hypothetical protein
MDLNDCSYSVDVRGAYLPPVHVRTARDTIAETSLSLGILGNKIIVEYCDPWRWGHYILSKRRYPITHWRESYARRTASSATPLRTQNSQSAAVCYSILTTGCVHIYRQGRNCQIMWIEFNVMLAPRLSTKFFCVLLRTHRPTATFNKRRCYLWQFNRLRRHVHCIIKLNTHTHAHTYTYANNLLILRIHLLNWRVE